jgi:hypothetical protein
MESQAALGICPYKTFVLENLLTTSAKFSKPQMLATTADRARRLEELTSAQDSVPHRGNKAVFIGLPDIISRHQKVTLQAFPKWSTRCRFQGIWVERTPNFISLQEYAQELKVLLKKSKDVKAYFDSLQDEGARQTGELDRIQKLYLRGCLLI